MTLSVGSLARVAAACCAIGFVALSLDGDGISAQARRPIVITRLYTGPDGEAAVQDVDVPFRTGDGATEVSDVFPATGLTFQRMAANDFANWHNTPQAKYALTLSGAIEIEVGGGKKVFVGPGNILLPGDATGKGHFNRRVGTEDRISAQVLLTNPASCKGSEFCVGSGAPGTVTITRLLTGPDGQARVQDFQRQSSDITPITGFQLLRVGPTGSSSLQRRRQYVIALRGADEIEIAQGKKIVLSAGQVLLIEDRSGRDYVFRSLDADGSVLVRLPLAAN